MLDTGFVDSDVLGINVDRRYHFRRKMTCAPLVTNSTYIRYEVYNESIGYYYSDYDVASFSHPYKFFNQTNFRTFIARYWYL